MERQIIYYKEKISANTRDNLRELSLQDQKWLLTVCKCYLALESADPRREFGQWFNMPNEHLPRQPRNKNERNSARTFCEGIIEKLQQSPNRRDLSPKQCDGIEALSMQMSQIYDIPYIEFKNKLQKNVPASLLAYNKVFA